jgi:hypothetical protein
MTPEEYFHDHPIIWEEDGSIYMYWCCDWPQYPPTTKIVFSEDDYVTDEDD